MIKSRHFEAIPPQPEAPTWAVAVHRLEAQLKRSCSAGSRVHVTLDDAFVRYLDLPWLPALDKRAEEISLARIRFKKLFGQRAQQWQVQVSGWRYGAPRLAVAVDAELIAAIRSAVLDAKGILGSIQPLFVSVMNRWRSLVPAQGQTSMAVVDGKQAVLGIVDGHGVSVLYKGPMADSSDDGLEALLRRECLRAGLAVPVRQFVFAPQLTDVPAGATRLALLPRTGFDPHADAGMSAALISV
ncbi:MAG: hypothetical protein KIS79_05770 [Burkholderiales bacterium]|nr:hypothetical protein [Burkholderiales bacterium]